MNKQGEIRKGMRRIIEFCGNEPDICVGELETYLDRKGVVIRVERDNENCRGCVGTGMIGGAGINDCCPDCNGTGRVFCVGYVAWEPLV